MWSDNETAIDAINVQHVVGAVVDILNTPHLTPITIGVFGPWGIGKSSVAQMVRQALTPEEGNENESETLVVFFNGWRFEGYEDAKAALMSTILEEIAKRRKLTVQARRLLKRLWRSVNVMQLVKGGVEAAAHVKLAALTGGLTAPVSLLMGLGRAAQAKASEATVGDAAKLVERTAGGTDADGGGAKKKREDDVARIAHRSVRDFEKHFATRLAETQLTKLIVVIDVLDRCLPPHVIDTLEAIRLFLAVKGTAFVIAADETLVQHAVKDRFPGMEALRAQVGQDYLEKMIQVPVRLPLLGRADLENYLNLLFAQRQLTPERFSSLCGQLLKLPAGGGGEQSAAEPKGLGRDVPFGLDTAEALLAGDYPKELKDDLALAKQIVHVVALSVDGNPRQVKRYLNALMLRLTMAKRRGVSINPQLAAKLMLLEYFRTEPFLQLAKWQATQRGRPREIAQLERARSGGGAAPEGVRASAQADRTAAEADDRREPVSRSAASRDASASASASRPGKAPHRRAGSDSRAKENGGADNSITHAESEPPLGPEGAAWLNDEWLRAWLDTEPRLAGVDLGPYFYFARDRFVARAVSTQQLGPLGEAVLAGLQESSRAARLAVRDRALGLTQPVAFAVLAALAERARLTGKPDAGDDSPYAAIYDIAEWRPEVAHEAVRFFMAQPVAVLRAQTPSRLLAATASGPAAAAARSLVQRWAEQTDNGGLAAGAKAALRTPVTPAVATARR